MVSYSIASARESDGASNLVIMSGKAGYLGESDVYLDYLRDGYISIAGNNPNETRGWRKLCEIKMEPGVYSLTGMKDVPDRTVAIELHIGDGTEFSQYIYQWDHDVIFTVKEETIAMLHIMVYPFVKDISVVARPAIYKNE